MTMTKIPIGLQLYSVRAECVRDLPAALKATADAGYQGAEPWGYNGQSLDWQGHSAADIRKLYDDNGLICCGIHLSSGALDGDNLKRTVEFNQILGNRFLILAGESKRMSSVEGVAEFAETLNRLAETLQADGMFPGYHAHGFDFKTLDGEIAWDRLFGSTRPEVIMQMDVGNCANGGGDPIATLRKFPNRARSVHLKDFGGPTPESVIGEGKADWPEVFRICETTQNTEWYVVEEGSSDGNGFDIPRRSLQALRAMGK
jgi:sugar phosphate isomerase/epimerase